MVENTITEEDLEKIQPDIEHNFPLPTMDSGIMDVYHNGRDNFIGNP